MSLTRAALRLATVRALRGQTMASRVLDSEIGAPEEIAAGSDQPEPLIVVYTDDVSYSERVGGCGPADLDGFQGAQTVFLEFLVTQRMRLEDDDQDVALVQPPTDRRLELAVDAMERQARSALMDPANAWAEIWRGFVMEIVSLKSQRGAWQRESGRVAGRQLDIQAVLTRDPAPGVDLDGHFAWGPFLAALETSGDGQLIAQAQEFRTLLAGNAGTWDDWEAMRAACGLTSMLSTAVLGGVTVTDTGDAANIDGVTVSGTTDGEEQSVVVTTEDV